MLEILSCLRLSKEIYVSWQDRFFFLVCGQFSIILEFLEWFFISFLLKWLQANSWDSANNVANFHLTSAHLHFSIDVTRKWFCTRLTVPPLARAKSQISPNGLVADARHECSTRTQMRTFAWQLFKREKEQPTRLSSIVSVRQQFVREFGLVKRFLWRMQIASYREYFHWIESLPVSNLVGFIHIFLLEFVLVISWPFLAIFFGIS